VRAFARPSPSLNGPTMMVPTYPEDGSRALKVYQHQHHAMVVRVGHKAPVVRVQGTIISRLRRPIAFGGLATRGP